MIPTVALPPKTRGVVYLTYTLIGLAVGAVQVGYLAASAAQPIWLTVALAVVPFLGAGLGLTAASNTQTEPTTVDLGSGYVTINRTVDLSAPEVGADGIPDDAPRRSVDE